MITTITRERLSFWLNDKEYVEIDIPDDLQQAVAAILEFAEAYKTPEQVALDAVLEAAFDSGKIEPETLATIARPWTEGETVNLGDVRIRDGQVYKATEKHVATESRGSLDETGQWVVYRQEKEITRKGE